MSDDWPFCPCGVTLMGDPDEDDGLCGVCAAQPHPGRDLDGIPNCGCDQCEAYWDRICKESRIAADEANRALICSCGWTGAFIEHHNSEAYGNRALPGCVMTFRDPERAGSLPKRWTGTDWVQVVASRGTDRSE